LGFLLTAIGYYFNSDERAYATQDLAITANFSPLLLEYGDRGSHAGQGAGPTVWVA